MPNARERLFKKPQLINNHLFSFKVCAKHSETLRKRKLFNRRGPEPLLPHACSKDKINQSHYSEYTRASQPDPVALRLGGRQPDRHNKIGGVARGG
jgi:hypothetical protein